MFYLFSSFYVNRNEEKMVRFQSSNSNKVTEYAYVNEFDNIFRAEKVALATSWINKRAEKGFSALKQTDQD